MAERDQHTHFRHDKTLTGLAWGGWAETAGDGGIIFWEGVIASKGALTTFIWYYLLYSGYPLFEIYNKCAFHTTPLVPFGS